MSLPHVIIQSIDRAETSGGQLFRRFKCIVYKTNGKYYEILTLYLWMRRTIIDYYCNIWIICLKLDWLFYDPSWKLQLSEFAWTLCSSVSVVFNNFILIDATDRSKISNNQKRLFFAVSQYPPWFFAKTPFKGNVGEISSDSNINFYLITN